MRVTGWLMAAVVGLIPAGVGAQSSYVPGPGEWERRDPAAVGMDAGRLREAIEFAQASETSGPRDLLEVHYRGFAREPFGTSS